MFEIIYFFISVLDECGVADWNVCDKTFANCKEKYAAYSCHCFPGYRDFSGTGETCMGKELLLPSQICTHISLGFILPTSYRYDESLQGIV